MPAAKALAQHVTDRTFRSRRHRDLLADSQVLPTPELAHLQSRYVSATHPLERQAIGLEFERAVAAQPEETGLPWPRQLYASCGPGAEQADWLRTADGTIECDAWNELQADWEAWDAKHGLAWRARHDCLSNGIVDVARVLGEPSKDLRELEPRRQELQGRFLRKVVRRRRVPDPPGWSNF